MRIADYAKKYHLTEQAIRGRIKRAGYTLADLRQPGSGHFTPEGEQIITALFDREPAAAQANGSRKGKESTQGGSRAAGSGGTLAVIRAERDELKIRATAAETLAAERDKTIKFLQEQIKEKDATISMLAAAAGAMRAALPEPEKEQEPKPADGHRRGLFAWIRKKGKK